MCPRRSYAGWTNSCAGKSAAPWKLVVGHHTIYSGGSGHGDTPETVQLIEPLLRKHAVQAYVNGHDRTTCSTSRPGRRRLRLLRGGLRGSTGSGHRRNAGVLQRAFGATPRCARIRIPSRLSFATSTERDCTDRQFLAAALPRLGRAA